MRFFLQLRSQRFLGPLCASFALAACVAPPPTAVPVAAVPAHVTIANLTPHAWAIGVTPMQGSDTRTLQVAAHATVQLDLAGGDYRIEQTLVTPPDRTLPARQFVASFTAGESYRWPLATLQSGGAVEETSDAGAGVR